MHKNIYSTYFTGLSTQAKEERYLNYLLEVQEMNEDETIKLEPKTMGSETNFSNDFLSSSPVRGEIGKGANFEEHEVRDAESTSQSPDSCSPCPNDEDQRFNGVWTNGQFPKQNGRKEGDSGFISPAGTTNNGHVGMEGINPSFYEANFHAGLHKTSSNDYDSSKTPSLGTEPEGKEFLSFCYIH